MPKMMPFGKYKGTPIHQLPVDYVQWLLLQTWIGPNLRSNLADHPGLEALYRQAVAAERIRPKKRYTKPFSLPPGFTWKPRNPTSKVTQQKPM